MEEQRRFKKNPVFEHIKRDLETRAKRGPSKAEHGEQVDYKVIAGVCDHYDQE